MEDVVKRSEIIFYLIQTPHGEKYEGITRILIQEMILITLI